MDGIKCLQHKLLLWKKLQISAKTLHSCAHTCTMFRLHIFHLVAWQEWLLNMLCLRILDTRLNFIQNMPQTSKSNSSNKVLNQVSVYLEIKHFCFSFISNRVYRGKRFRNQETIVWNLSTFTYLAYFFFLFLAVFYLLSTGLFL